MHVLFAAEVWPHPGHDKLSAHQVIYALMRSFREELGWRVSFVCTYRPDRRPGEGIEQASREALTAFGVTALPPIEIPQPAPVSRFRLLVCPRAQDDFPEAAHRSRANALVRDLRPDAVIVPWSERATQLFAEAPCLRVAYYGNPDPKNMRINAVPPIRPSRGWLGDRLMRIRLAQFERMHLREMRRYHVFGNVAANDAEYYRRAGIDGAFYARMVYGDRAPADWMARRDELEPRTPKRIVANIGSQAATGNILALHYLADRVIAPLRRRLGDDLELVLLGGGKLPADLAAKLAVPGVNNLGFVDDIDTILLGAPVFLCLNNATAYKVNQSRYLHVWSLGGCIVAHRDAALSLPEMVDGKNALLGADPDAIVGCIMRALADRTLRRALGADGRKTYRELFNANAVARDLARRIEAKSAALTAPSASARAAA